MTQDNRPSDRGPSKFLECSRCPSLDPVGSLVVTFLTGPCLRGVEWTPLVPLLSPLLPLLVPSSPSWSPRPARDPHVPSRPTFLERPTLLSPLPPRTLSPPPLRPVVGGTEVGPLGKVSEFPTSTTSVSPFDSGYDLRV